MKKSTKSRIKGILFGSISAWFILFALGPISSKSMYFLFGWAMIPFIKFIMPVVNYFWFPSWGTKVLF